MTKASETNFVIFSIILLKKYEVKTMELTNKHVSTSARTWTSRAEGKHPHRLDYYSELRSWLQRAVIEAEKTQNVNKKDQLLILLKDL